MVKKIFQRIPVICKLQIQLCKAAKEQGEGIPLKISVQILIPDKIDTCQVNITTEFELPSNYPQTIIVKFTLLTLKIYLKIHSNGMIFINCVYYYYQMNVHI